MFVWVGFVDKIQFVRRHFVVIRLHVVASVVSEPHFAALWIEIKPYAIARAVCFHTHVGEVWQLARDDGADVSARRNVRIGAGAVVQQTIARAVLGIVWCITSIFNDSTSKKVKWWWRREKNVENWRRADRHVQSIAAFRYACVAPAVPQLIRFDCIGIEKCRRHQLRCLWRVELIVGVGNFENFSVGREINIGIM